MGCGIEAYQKKAKCYYFYNSLRVPKRTELLFSSYNTNSLLVDIGPQAISGSTRLQAATLAELCLGSTLEGLFSKTFDKSKSFDLELHVKQTISSIMACNESIIQNLRQIKKIVELEYEVFSGPDANFRKISDQTNKGYVTFLAYDDAIREVLIDATETAPTFSTNPPRRTSEQGKKQAEFQAFLFRESDNLKAWTKLLGREVNKQDLDDVSDILIGLQGLNKRNLSKGNLVIGVTKDTTNIPTLESALIDAKREGAKIGLILCSSNLELQKNENIDALVSIDFPSDSLLGVVNTVCLKQVLNMISNSSMVLMNKVYGNKMIDVRASNNKLLDRCIRLTKEIWKIKDVKLECSDRELFHLVNAIEERKKEYEENRFEYTPSTVKIIVTMLALGCDFEKAVSYLRENQESITDFL